MQSNGIAQTCLRFCLLHTLDLCILWINLVALQIGPTVLHLLPVARAIFRTTHSFFSPPILEKRFPRNRRALIIGWNTSSWKNGKKKKWQIVTFWNWKKIEKRTNITVYFICVFLVSFYKMWAIPGLFSFFIFVLFTWQFKNYKLNKASLVCLGFETRPAGW